MAGAAVRLAAEEKKQGQNRRFAEKISEYEGNLDAVRAQFLDSEDPLSKFDKVAAMLKDLSVHAVRDYEILATGQTGAKNRLRRCSACCSPQT